MTFIFIKVDGLGTYSNVAVYAALVASCMFLPSWVIKTFTVKWGLVMSMFCYTAYIATQFYPQFYTIIPGAIVVGIGAAPMWSAKCTYLTQVSGLFILILKPNLCFIKLFYFKNASIEQYDNKF